MSLGRLETALYDLGVDRAARKLFVDDLAAFSEKYRLEPHESDALRRFDVARLQQLGANPMLTMGFWMQLEPGHDMNAYIAALRLARSSGGVR